MTNNQSLNELMDAANAVIKRWDSPLWKDLPATADYIYRLRKAVANQHQAEAVCPYVITAPDTAEGGGGTSYCGLAVQNGPPPVRASGQETIASAAAGGSRDGDGLPFSGTIEWGDSKVSFSPCPPKREAEQDVRSGEISDNAQARHQKWHQLTDHLPCVSSVAHAGWLWHDSEIEMLRAASKVRFGESIRTETLFTIAMTGIRIYLSRIQREPVSSKGKCIDAETLRQVREIITEFKRDAGSEWTALCCQTLNRLAD